MFQNTSWQRVVRKTDPVVDLEGFRIGDTAPSADVREVVEKEFEHGQITGGARTRVRSSDGFDAEIRGIGGNIGQVVVRHQGIVGTVTKIDGIRDRFEDLAEIIGLHPIRIMLVVILPNILSPLLVIGTVDLAVAILLEATLSFLGVGVPPNQPSLGTLIRIGTEYIFSGEWWILLFPAITLLALALSVNLLGDWLRDALNPRLR